MGAAPTLALLCSVMVFAFTVEAMLGFGATVIAVALGSMLMPLDAVLSAFVPVNLAISVVLVVRNVRDVDVRLLFLRMLPVMALGMPFGMFAFDRLPESALKRVFGLFLLALVGASRLRAKRRGKSATPPQKSNHLLLFLGGVVHGAFATGGPVVVAVLSRMGTPKAVFRATLSLLWAVLSLMLVVKWLIAGSLGAQSLRLSALLCVPMVIGLIVGDALYRRVNEEKFRVGVDAMLAVCGAVLIARG